MYDSDSHASFLDGLKLGRVESQPFEHNDAPGARPRPVRRAHPAPRRVRRRRGRVLDVGRRGPARPDRRRHRTPRGVVGRRRRARDGRDRAERARDRGHVRRGRPRHGRGRDVLEGVLRVRRVHHRQSGRSSSTSAISPRPYVFSSSLSPAVCAAVLAGLDVLDGEPERHAALADNSGYLADRLTALGFQADGLTPIFPAPGRRPDRHPRCGPRLPPARPVRQPDRGAGRPALPATVPIQRQPPTTRAPTSTD